MKRLSLAAILTFSLFIFGCASFPKNDIEIEAEADPKANFSGYNSYAWLGGLGIVNDPQGKWKPLGFDADAEIAFLIDRELRKRGMTESSANPDMLVGYAVGVDTELMQFKEDPESNVRVLEDVPQGALVIILEDPETELVIWAAVAVAELQNQGDEIAKQRLNYAVTEMFKKLPK